jgi:hypothetical protein
VSARKPGPGRQAPDEKLTQLDDLQPLGTQVDPFDGVPGYDSAVPPPGTYEGREVFSPEEEAQILALLPLTDDAGGAQFLRHLATSVRATVHFRESRRWHESRGKAVELTPRQRAAHLGRIPQAAEVLYTLLDRLDGEAQESLLHVLGPELPLWFRDDILKNERFGRSCRKPSGSSSASSKPCTHWRRPRKPLPLPRAPRHVAALGSTPNVIN